MAALGGTPAQIAIGGAVGAGTGFVIGELTSNRVVSPEVCHAVNQFGQEPYVTRSGQIVTYRTGNSLLVQC